MRALFSAAAARVRALLFPGDLRRGIDDEIDGHLAQEVERLVATGRTPNDARLEARRTFGNVTLHREAAREAYGWQALGQLRQDIAFGVRHYARTPVATATILVTLALGIGVNSALFGFLRAARVDPVPGVAADPALVRIRASEMRPQRFGVLTPTGRFIPYAQMREYAKQTSVLAAVALESNRQLTVDMGPAGRVARPGLFVTPNYFQLLRVQLTLGPGLPIGDFPGNPSLVAVIGDQLWREQFAGAPDVVGRTLRVNGVLVTVVGVAPPNFDGVTGMQGRTGLWLPLATTASLARDNARKLLPIDSTAGRVVARLQPGVAMRTAEAMVAAVGVGFLGANATIPGAGTDVVPLRAGNVDPLHEQTALTATALVGIVTLLILLVVSTNVSSLLIGRAVGRRGEIAVRLSLGAPRMRIVRQLVAESMVLALGGGALGILLHWAIGVILERRAGVHIATDGWTMGFTLAFALGTVLLFGLTPALHASRGSTADALRQSAGARGGSRSRTQRSDVIAQVALSQPLLIGLAVVVALLLRSTPTGADVDLSERTATVELEWHASAPLKEQPSLDALAASLASVPWVEATAVMVTQPWSNSFAVHGKSTNVHSEIGQVTSGYFAARQIPIIAGRDFDATDVDDRHPPVVIDEALARAVWGTTNPLGQLLVSRSASAGAGERFTVIGIVGVTAESREPRAYTALRLDRVLGRTLLVRTTGPAASLLPMLRQFAQADSTILPVRRISTLALDAEARRGLAVRAGSAAGAGGIVVLLLAAIGLYAVVAVGVQQRTREIGVRIALGARPSAVANLFFRDGTRLGAIGMALGFPLGIGLVKLMERVTGSLQVNVVALGACVSVVVFAIIALATWLPARRAANVDPIIALRSDP